jgi:hypothetical protein
VDLEEHAAAQDEGGQRTPPGQSRDARGDHGERSQAGQRTPDRQPRPTAGLGQGRRPAEPRFGQPEARPEPGDDPVGRSAADQEQRCRAEDRDDLKADHRQPQRKPARSHLLPHGEHHEVGRQRDRHPGLHRQQQGQGGQPAYARGARIRHRAR